MSSVHAQALRGNLLDCYKMKKLLLSVIVTLALGSCTRPGAEWVSEPASGAYLERGKELAQGLAACGYCHGAENKPDSPLTGGRTFSDRYGAVRAPNLTPARSSGLHDWSAAQIVRAVRSGTGRFAEPLSQDVHRGYEWMSDQDALALAVYLRNLPPAENEVPRRSIGILERNTTGLFESAREVKGYVPAINPRFTEAYGKYLTDHVARCTYCHNGSGGIFSGEAYLAGGETITNEQGSRIAPALTSDKLEGLGDWGESDIVNYLRSGQTPAGSMVDRSFCPIDFYAQASAGDLAAIARYLKSLP